MEPLRLLYLIILTYAAFRSIRGLIRVHSTIAYLLKKASAIHSQTQTTSKNNFVILIPVLREQEIIKETFENFSNLEGSYELIFICTQKELYEKNLVNDKLKNSVKELVKITSVTTFVEETSGIFGKSLAVNVFEKLGNFSTSEQKCDYILETYSNKPSTHDMLSDYIQKTQKRNVKIVVYPQTAGVMAHQLNFACEQLLRTRDKENTFILVYNADSKVSPDLIPQLEKFLEADPSASVIQQSALFLGNYQKLGQTLPGSMLKAVALLQTRWTLIHELPRLINQQENKFGMLCEPAHVVGHGLIVKLATINEVGLFPVIFMNEDLPLGYLLRLYGYKIHVFPTLEMADSPTTVTSMFKQYRTWFYGVSSYPLYMGYALSLKKFNRLKVLLWGIVYSGRGILWLFSSIAWFYLLLYPLATGSFPLLLASLTVYLVYAPLSFRYLEHLYNKYRNDLINSNQPKLKIDIKTYLMTLPVYLSHSWGPILSTYDMFNKMFFKRAIYKNKTER